MSNQPFELPPPWEAFPTYERHTIGWRMGPGEAYLVDWRKTIEALPRDYDVRLAYLRRFRPAPLNWCDELLSLLYSSTGLDLKLGCSSAEIDRLLKLQLVEPDAAYRTWHSKQVGITWPWLMPVGDTPEEAARYRTREFWFFSRHLLEVRQSENVAINEIPSDWRSVESQLQTGQLGEIDSKNGLLTLAQMFCAGDVQPPWVLDLSISSFSDSFGMDMGYCDAFRLWIMCAFDDDKLLQKILNETSMPGEWADWIDEQVSF